MKTMIRSLILFLTAWDSYGADINSSLPVNTTQFGNVNISTGTGTSGTGIPRVTVSNDSNILASQSGTWTTGRTWSLLNSTDSVNSVQSGTWTTGRTWTLSSGTDSISAIQSTSPWVNNISQFGGTNVVTGTGASGLGIPRFTVSNDSNILATQSGTWTVQQGSTPTSVANAWPFKITDGTNTTAVKAASTAPVATDPAAVVALSPNGNQATAALQTTGNSSLASIDAGIPAALGAATTANSMPVNIASDQIVPMNISQVAGNTVNTGIGAAGTGTARVAVSNDSQIKVWDGTTIAKVAAGSAQAVLTDPALIVTGRPDNVGTPTQTSISCAATSTTVLAASTATMFLSIRNPTTSTQTIWINVTGVAAVAAAPSIDLAPGSEYDAFAEGASFLPTAQVNCISGGSASTVTLVYK